MAFLPTMFALALIFVVQERGSLATTDWQSALSLTTSEPTPKPMINPMVNPKSNTTPKTTSNTTSTPVKDNVDMPKLCSQTSNYTDNFWGYRVAYFISQDKVLAAEFNGSDVQCCYLTQ